MIRSCLAFGLAFIAFGALVPSAQAKEKVAVSCFYESGQNGNQKISDYNIVNMHGPTIPKGTVVSFTLSSAPGKTYTVSAPKDIAAMDDFPTGGNYPMGDCTAWWMK